MKGSWGVDLDVMEISLAIDPPDGIVLIVGCSHPTVEKIVEGQALNPVWSPAGGLIVYVGPQVEGGFAAVLGVRPDGTPVELPSLEVMVRGQRMRFLPDGRGLVHLNSATNFHQNFWLLDLATMQDRQLTQLDDAGTIHTFDIAPDGGSIVFDRLRDHSDIVLIDLAGKLRSDQGVSTSF